MSTLLEITIKAGVAQAVDRAFRERDEPIGVYVDHQAGKVYVRGTHDDPNVVGDLPTTARLHCFAQWWSTRTRSDGTEFDTVQIRLGFAQSEWITKDKSE
jgi:hypothetical protein